MYKGKSIHAWPALFLLSFVLLACNAGAITAPAPTPCASPTATGRGTAALPTAALVRTATPAVTRSPLVEVYGTLQPYEGRIVFEADANGDHLEEIYVLDAIGVHPLILNDGTFSNGSPAWSPDGRTLAFDSNRYSARANIYLLSVDSSEVWQVTDFPPAAVAGSPAWSPDGTRIAFEGITETNGTWEFDIFVINADGSGLINLTNTGGDEMRPDWSPDGQRIAFDSWEGICVMNADGSDRRIIVPGRPGHTYGGPAWSPDGRRIAFHSLWRIYVVDANGENLSGLTYDTFRGASLPTWSPDGRKIAFSDSEFIYILDVESGNVTRLVRGRHPEWHE